MADRSAIEWTEATWNPLRGCSRVSPGCQHCYAERVAARFSGPGMPYEGLIHPKTRGWNGTVRLAPEVLAQPIRWQRARRIFVNSMSDLFHESVPDTTIDLVFGVMWACLYNRHEQPGHIFQVLTKRPERMLNYLQKDRRSQWAQAAVNYGGGLDPDGLYDQTLYFEGPHPRIWLGVSVENQAAADERIPLLLQCPAAVRWLSCEPLLGPVDLRAVSFDSELQRRFYPAMLPVPWLDWVVAGGESGPGARPMHPDWARSLRDQCAAAGVPFFFKQWGAWLPGQNDSMDEHDWARGLAVAHWQNGSWGARKLPRDPEHNYVMWEADGAAHFGARTIDNPFPVHRFAERIGKRAAGRLLDGAEHNAYPAVAHVG